MNKRRSISNRAALNTSGHSVSQGGLRGHSIGELYPYSIDPCLVDWHGNGVLTWGWKVRNLLTDGYIIECKTFGSGLYFARVFKRRRDELQEMQPTQQINIDTRGWRDAF